MVMIDVSSRQWHCSFRQERKSSCLFQYR